MTRLTKRQKRIARQNGDTEIDKPTLRSDNFQLKNVNPITDNQRKVVDAFNDNKHLMLHGCAGTGKTFLSMYLALSDIMGGVSDQNKIDRKSVV